MPIGSSIKNFRDRIRANLTVKSINFIFFFCLALIFFLAIFIRLSPLSVDNYLIKAFDPWIQYYNAEYLSTHSVFEYFNWHDIKSWFPEGVNRAYLRPGLTFTVVGIYGVLNSLGIPVTLYDVCFFFPAFMGGLTVLAAYLVGKEALNRSCGLLAAFFLAFNTGFMQRTTAGFFDNETIGVFATLMTLYFFIKTIKTGSYVHSILGGIFLGYLALSWGGYNFVFFLLPIVCGILILMKKYTANMLIAYAGIQGTGLLIFSLYTSFDHTELFSSLEIGGVFLFTIVLVVFHLLHTKKTDYPRFYNGFIGFLKWVVIPGIIILAIVIWVAPWMIPFGFGARLQSILSPFIREQLNIVASVAEHMPSPWGIFYYNTLVPLMLLPLGIFFLFKKADPAAILFMVFLIIIFYFTGSMIRIILLFAPAAALVGAYGLVNVLQIYGSFYGEKTTGVSRKRKKQLKRTVGKSEITAVYVIVGIICIAQVFHAAEIATNQLSSSQIAPGGEIRDWEETMTWMKTNLPGTSVVVSWWDYGYWITPVGNMTTVNDNSTHNSTKIGLTGMAMMQTNEIYSAKVFQKLQADYVLVYFGLLYPGLGGDEGKWPWMVRICNDNYEKYKKWGMEENNWADNSVFEEGSYFNETSQLYRSDWFQSQLVQMMFYGLPTDPVSGEPRTFVEYYQQQINGRVDDHGNPWVANIPAGGNYQFNVFTLAYASTNRMVKVFKVDYTALESEFEIFEPKVYDSGYAAFRLSNTGSKNITISNVKIQGENYDFTMASGEETNLLPTETDVLVWVDFKSSGKSFKVNDVVNISVEAQAEALGGRTYSFSKETSNLFVEEGIQGNLQINKENSNVIQIDETTADVYLEVENTGATIEVIDSAYINDPTNKFTSIEYITGSSILSPGEKAYMYLPNAPASFYPLGTNQVVGITTPSGLIEEVLITSNFENFKLSVLNASRIVSPEVIAATNSTLRDHIPINFESTHVFTFDNDTTIINLKVKNTGDVIMGLDTISISKNDAWSTVTGWTPLNLNPGAEGIIPIIASDYFNFDVNDEIGISVTTNFDGSTKASDTGYIHSIRDQPDIQILETVDDELTSYIFANETGKLLIKNTGNTPIVLDKFSLNDTVTYSFDTDVSFLYGDVSLDMQECAHVAFDITGLNINATNIVRINVTTVNDTASTVYDLTAVSESLFYNIVIDDGSTSASKSGFVEIAIDNIGLFNVTVDSVYVNGTYIPLGSFNENNFFIETGGSLLLTIHMTTLESYIGTVVIGEKLEITVRTKEGAEYTHEEVIAT